MTNDERKIKEKLQHKTWNEIKTKDAWGIFKVMAEFVDGYEKLSKIGPCVSVFGSARTQEDHEYYKLAEEIAFQLTQNGYGVITGGGPGIMEAGNKGAHRGKGVSVGLNIELPFEPITLIQTKKIGRFPIVLVGTEFWSGLLEWIKKTLIAQGNISEEDLKLFRIVDTAEEAVAHLNKFYSKYLLKPNF